MRTHSSLESGFSLLETMIAMSVLTVGMLGAAAVFTQGMQKVTGSPADLIATEKASEAIESVMSARDTRTLTWAQMRNVHGASGSDGGVFVDDPQPLKLAGVDGILGTADDAVQPVESQILPGPDQILGTADDQTQTLDEFTREIKIRDVQQGLRSVEVTITYRVGSAMRTYVLTTYISDYA
jgi:prepilin-type N-terminal cleavage/methylation domain-containing protein